ncbi:unnamed protein product [Boreogadus saida]
MWYKAREPSTVVPSPAEGEHSGKEVLSSLAGLKRANEAARRSSLAGPQEPHAGVHPGDGDWPVGPWTARAGNNLTLDWLRFPPHIKHFLSAAIHKHGGGGNTSREFKAALAPFVRHASDTAALASEMNFTPINCCEPSCSHTTSRALLRCASPHAEALEDSDGADGERAKIHLERNRGLTALTRRSLCPRPDHTGPVFRSVVRVLNEEGRLIKLLGFVLSAGPSHKAAGEGRLIKLLGFVLSGGPSLKRPIRRAVSKASYQQGRLIKLLGFVLSGGPSHKAAGEGRLIKLLGFVLSGGPSHKAAGEGRLIKLLPVFVLSGGPSHKAAGEGRLIKLLGFVLSGGPSHKAAGEGRLIKLLGFVLSGGPSHKAAGEGRLIKLLPVFVLSGGPSHKAAGEGRLIKLLGFVLSGGPSHKAAGVHPIRRAVSSSCWGSSYQEGRLIQLPGFVLSGGASHTAAGSTNGKEPFSCSSRPLFCTSNRSEPLSRSSRPLFCMSNRSEPLSRSSHFLFLYVQWEPIAQLFLPPPLLFVQWDRAAQPGGSRLEVGLRQAGCSQAEALLGGGGARGPRGRGLPPPAAEAQGIRAAQDQGPAV